MFKGLATEITSFECLHLQPGHAPYVVFIFIKFASNQFLVPNNFKDLSSSFQNLDLIITVSSHCHQSLLVVVKVNTDDPPFTLVYDDFYLSDLFRWIEGVTIREAIWSSLSLARLPIIEGETN